MKIKNKWIDITLAINCFLLYVFALLISILFTIETTNGINNGTALENTDAPMILVIFLLICACAIMIILSHVFLLYSIFYIKNFTQKMKIEQAINKNENINLNKGFVPNVLALSINTVVVVCLFGAIWLEIRGFIFEEYSYNIALFIAEIFCFTFFLLNCFYWRNKIIETRLIKKYLQTHTFEETDLTKPHKINLALSIISLCSLVSILVFLIIQLSKTKMTFLYIMLYLGFIIYFALSSLFYLYENQNTKILHKTLKEKD